MSKITFADKVTLDAQPSIAAINKVTAEDMNEIKSAVNDIDDKLSTITDLYTATGDVSGGSITLDDSIQNYDFILVGIQAVNFSKSTMLIPVSDIVTGSDNYNTYEISIFQSSNTYASLQIKFTDNTTIYLNASHYSGWADVYLRYVKGIKL